MYKYLFYALCFIYIFAVSLFADSITTQGGNVTTTNLTLNDTAQWSAYVGTVTIGNSSPAYLNVTGNISAITLYTDSCQAGINYLNFYFANSSSIDRTSIQPGNLSLLDNYINAIHQGGTATFGSTIRAYNTFFSGTISGVPTVYTNTADGQQNFYEGYLNDNRNNIIFIMSPNYNKIAYNGARYDFQFMLPQASGNPTQYYITTELVCNSLSTSSGGSSGSSPKPLTVSASQLTCPGNLVNLSATQNGASVSGVLFRLILYNPYAGFRQEAYSGINGNASFNLTNEQEGALYQVDSYAQGYTKPYDIFFNFAHCTVQQTANQASNYSNKTIQQPKPVPKITFYDLTVPASLEQGQDLVIQATKDSAPCASCSLTITYPDGKKTTSNTDVDGKLKLGPLPAGQYSVSLAAGGQLLTKLFTILPKPVAQNPVINKPEQTVQPPKKSSGPDIGQLLIAAVILVIGAAAYYFMLRPKKFQPPPAEAEPQKTESNIKK